MVGSLIFGVFIQNCHLIRAAGTYLNMENLEFKLTLPNLIAMELECSYLACFGICLGLEILKYQDQIQELVTQPIKDALEMFGAYYGEAKDKILGLLADIKETAMSFKYKIKDGLEQLGEAKDKILVFLAEPEQPESEDQRCYLS